MTALLHWLGLESGTKVLEIVTSQWVAARPLAPVLVAVIGVLGLALSLVNFLPQLGMRRRVRVLTALLRLAMVGILLLALLAVEWRLKLSVAKPQEWLVLVDDSASMQTVDVAGRSRFAAALDDLDLLRRRSASVKLRVASFSGERLQNTPGQGQTDFRAVIDREVLSFPAVDRLILLTDGRDSTERRLAGLGAEIAARGSAVTVCVYGEEDAPRDRGIAAAPDRQTLRLGERLQVRCAIAAGAGVSDDVSVVLKENGKQVVARKVTAEESPDFEISYRPLKAGRHTYSVVLPSGDAMVQNDQASFVVDVVEQPIRVLLLDGYPRFEFKLFKTVLEVDPMVDLVSVCQIPGAGVYVQGEPLHRNPEQGLIDSQADLFKYDVIIFRDLPRQLFRAGGDTTESRLQHIVSFVTRRGGGLLVTGGQDAYRAGGYEDSHLAPILPFDLSDSISALAQFEGLFYVDVPEPAFRHPILQLLSPAAENRVRLKSLRQLDGSNNVGRVKPMASPLLTRTVELQAADGSTATATAPIMAVMSIGDGKVVATAVDTMWRWQLQPEFGDPPLTALLANIVRYLAPPPGRSPGKPSLDLYSSQPQVGGDLELTTVLRDQNYNPIRQAELRVVVTRPDQTTLRIFPRDLPDEPGIYRYRVPIQQPGSFSVAVTHDKETTKREFIAGANAGELADLSAAPAAMAEFGGEMPASLSEWLSTADMSPAIAAAERELEVWNSRLVLLLFIFCVSLDCYVRKRQGLV